jgi:pilus assembly protein CpaC
MKKTAQAKQYASVALIMALMTTNLVPFSAASAQSGSTGAGDIKDAADAPRLVTIGKGKGMTIRLPRAAKNVFIAEPTIADVNPVSNQLVYIFGKTDGETTFYAVDANDRVIYSSTVRVMNNVTQLGEMLRMAMPNATIDVKPLNGMIFLTGLVGSPAEIEEAGRLAQAMVGEGQQIINRLQTKTPAQIHLQVKFAEVSRDTVKSLAVNLQSTDVTGGFGFGLFRGRDFLTDTLLSATAPGGGLGTAFNLAAQDATSMFGSGKAFGLNILSAVDALEQVGLLSVLAEPTLTALSGEQASFLAGGEFPIIVPQDGGINTVEFKEYGVKLEFMPTVHSGNRISLKVKPEVSQLSSAGAVVSTNVTISALTTRRAETTVELGSGQSFMIAGLLQSTASSDISRLPGLGNMPVIGALFKSDRFRRQETELVIIVTPYLVNPVNANDIRLPTDGYRAPNDLQRYLLGKTFQSGINTAKTPSVARTGATTSATPANAGASNQSDVRPGLSFGK